MPNWEIFLSLVMAFMVGLFIGSDRERQGHSAGARTHILVAIGACIIALVQRDLFQVDDRMVAQVISGVGFLGAGTIVVTRHSIKGLTTAATIWLCACLGLVIGLGAYLISVSALCLCLLALHGLKWLFHSKVQRLEVVYKVSEFSEEELIQIFKRHDLQYKRVSFSYNKEMQNEFYRTVYQLTFKQEHSRSSLIQTIGSLSAVVRCRIISV